MSAASWRRHEHTLNSGGLQGRCRVANGRAEKSGLAEGCDAEGPGGGEQRIGLTDVSSSHGMK